MNEMAECTVAISQNVKVEIGAHFSKFVKVHKFQKNIALAAKTWRFIMNNVSMIDSCLSENTEFKLSCTESKSLRVGMFRDQSQVTFCEDFVKNNDKFTKYVSLNKWEWSALTKQQERINQLLDYDVIATDENGTPGFSNLLAAIDNNVKKRLVPRMCAKTFALQLCAYLVTDTLEKTKNVECYGCQIASDKPGDHALNDHGCKAPWNTIVQARFDDAKQALNVAAAIERINTAMGWSMEVQDIPDEQELRNVVLNHKALTACAACKLLLPIYWNMYYLVLA